MKHNRAFAVLLAVLALTAPFYAQTTNVTLSGTITDPTDRIVPAVEVTATNIDTGVASKTKTNGDGIYTLPGLQPGHYRIIVLQQGFRRIELTGLTLDVAASVTRNFRLALGAESQTVVVQGNTLNINTTDGSVSTVINRDFIDQIPLNGRTLQNLLPLSPGIVSDGFSSSNVGYTGFSVNGNRDTGSVYWTVDGISTNFGATPNSSLPDTLAGSLTVLQTTQSLVSLDALQEFRLSTSSYGVEYGAAPGAQVQLETRAGTSRFHGSAYDYLRNTVFDANDWFADREGLAKAPEHQNDFGATVGGPVWIPHLYDGRDKAFFFFSFEDLHLLQPNPVAGQPVPTQAYRQSAPAAFQPYLNAFPMPNGDSYGDGWAAWNTSFSLPSFLKSWSLRGDYALSKSTKLFAHANYTPSSIGGLYDAYNANYITNNVAVTIGATTVLTSSISNDFRFNFSRSYYAQTTNLLPSSYGGTPGPAVAALTAPSQYTAPGGGGVYSNIVFEDDSLPGSAVLLLEDESSRLHQWDLVEGLKWQVGRHLLRFGGEWNRHTPIQAPVAYEQTFQFYELSSVAASTADEVDLLSQPYVTSTIVTRSAFYGGDTWKVNRRLSVDYGVRWELPFPTYYQGPYVPLYVSSIANLANPTLTAGRTEWNMSWSNFAPRLGIAYLLGNTDNFQTVLRTGGGLFYSTELGAGTGNVGYPNVAYGELYDVPFPVDPSLLVPPQTGVVTPEGLLENPFNGFAPHLAVPRVWEWNVAVEQGLGLNQSLTLNYVGSAGRKLFYYPSIIPTGEIEEVNYTNNGSQSDYNSFQAKFDRRLTHGLQTLASYTWSHGIDNLSQDNFQDQPLWGNSDYDVRHAFSLAFVYDIPGAGNERLLKTVTSGWEISNNFQARTGLPTLNLFAPEKYLPNGNLIFTQAELVPGVPVYLHGSQYPGGTKLNRAAFAKPAAGQQGDVARNEFRDLGFWQEDMSLQRKFALGEKWGTLRFRADAFNILNHPNFAGFFVRNLTTSSLFGQATSMANLFGGSPIYASGGPRSLQLSLRYEF